MTSMEGMGGLAVRAHDYRFRNDDGDVDNDGVAGGQEAGASWKAAINTNISLPINAPKFRIRFGCEWDDNSDTGVLNFNVGWSLDGTLFANGYLNSLANPGGSRDDPVHTVPARIAITSSEMEHNRDTVETYADAQKLWDFGADTWISDDTLGGCIAGPEINSAANGRTGSVVFDATFAPEGWAIEVCVLLNASQLQGDVGNDIEFRPETFPSGNFLGIPAGSGSPYFESASTYATVTLLAADPGYDEFLPVTSRQQQLGRIVTR